MTLKSANVTARVEPDIKLEAEAILEKLGLPVSVVINSLYRQIILKRGIPFALELPAAFPAAGDMTDAELAAMLREGLRQAECRQGRPMEEVFSEIRQSADL